MHLLLLLLENDGTMTSSPSRRQEWVGQIGRSSRCCGATKKVLSLSKKIVLLRYDYYYYYWSVRRYDTQNQFLKRASIASNGGTSVVLNPSTPLVSVEMVKPEHKHYIEVLQILKR